MGFNKIQLPVDAVSVSSRTHCPTNIILNVFSRKGSPEPTHGLYIVLLWSPWAWGLRSQASSMRPTPSPNTVPNETHIRTHIFLKIDRPPWGHQAVCLQHLYRHGEASRSQRTRLKPSVSSRLRTRNTRGKQVQLAGACRLTTHTARPCADKAHK